MNRFNSYSRACRSGLLFWDRDSRQSVHVWCLGLLAVCWIPVTGWAQSTSLYTPALSSGPSGEAVNIPIVSMSFIRVPPPEIRQYAKDDLITIIIRESTQSSWESSLETEKDAEIKGAVRELPDLGKLLRFNLKRDDPDVGVDLDFGQEFKGEGEFTRGEVITGRLQARVMDVRPNGTLVLEARKYNQVDNESLTMILTGTCRTKDVTVDNTILSTQLYDLHLVKTHKGELGKVTSKGIVTRLFEFIFNF